MIEVQKIKRKVQYYISLKTHKTNIVTSKSNFWEQSIFTLLFTSYATVTATLLDLYKKNIMQYIKYLLVIVDGKHCEKTSPKACL